MTITRVGCYERVSTEEQALHGFSINTQIDNLVEYCEQNRMKIIDHYTDEGISGAKPPLKRPALQRLLNDVKAGKIDLILFTKLDRWFRSVREYHKVQEILDQHGVQWKTIHEDYDTTTANGQLTINLYLAIAQNERDKAAERVKVVLEHKRKNKEACFGGQAVPFGYKKELDETGINRLVKDPETMGACQAFWNVLVTTNNMNKAIRLMMTEYGYNRDWKTWKRMSQSDFYCGVHRGVADYCEPYVSVEDFIRIQDTKRVKATASGSVYLFRTLMRCPECGNKLCGDSTKKSYGVYKSYRCTSRCRGCSFTSSVSEKKLEKQLMNSLVELLHDEIQRVEAEARKPKAKPKNNVKPLKERLRRLTNVYMSGNMPDEEYFRQDAELKVAIAKAEAEAPPKPRDVAPLKKLLASDFQTTYWSLTEEEKQQFWQSLIKEIRLNPDKTIKEVIFF